MIVTYRGLSASIPSAIRVAYGIDGSPIVQVPESGCEVVMTSGPYEVNLPGSHAGDIFGASGVVASPTSTVLVTPGDVMLVGSVVAPQGVYRTTPNNYPVAGSQTRSQTDEVMRIAFVGYAPSDGQLAPAAFGSMSDPLVVPLRQSLPTPMVSSMPSVVDLSMWTDQENTPLTWSVLESVFDGFGGECWQGWNTDTSTPATADLGGYGRDVASWVSKALIFMSSTEPDYLKQRLGMLITQRGIDLASAFATGRTGYANGGHMQGRTAIVIAAGDMLGLTVMTTIANWLLAGKTQEMSQQYFCDPGFEWHHDSSWRALWQRTSDYTWGGAPIRLWEHPSQWTPDEKWAMNGYYFPCCGANVGTAIWARLSGNEHNIGKPWCEGILDQFMVPPSQDALNDFAANGVSTGFGIDFPQPWSGQGIQLQVFNALRAAGTI